MGFEFFVRHKNNNILFMLKFEKVTLGKPAGRPIRETAGILFLKETVIFSNEFVNVS